MTTALPTFRDNDVHGVGLGLRWAFLDEVLDGEAPPSIRFFEISPENYMRRGGFFPEALEAVADAHPVLTHGLMLNIGSTSPLDTSYLETLRDFLRRMGIHAHSDHLCWNGTDGHILHDLLPLSATQTTIDRVSERILRVQDALGVPMALENISYYLLPDSTMPEEEMIAALVERSGCQLLLDVNNVWVNARNHGFDPYTYLGALPLEEVAHLHVAGGQHLAAFDELVIDTHGTDVSPEVADLMAWVIERIGPRPVLYERDHNIPPLDELGAQVGALNVRYDAAVERWRAAQNGHREDRAPRPRIDLDTGAAREARANADAEAFERQIFTGFSRVLLAAGETPDTLLCLPSAVGEDARAHLQQLRPERLGVYRKLVRNGIFGTVYDFMPRTRAHRGRAALDEDIATWLDVEGPRSAYVRDLPYEFCDWITPRWTSTDGIPAYLHELAHYELMQMAIKALAEPTRPRIEPPPLTLDARIEFHASVRLQRYAHRVHEATRVGRDEPPAHDPVRLLAYRDREHDARFLELSELAERVISNLLEGRAFGASVTDAAGTLEIALDDATLARVGNLINELVERGVILGVAVPPT